MQTRTGGLILESFYDKKLTIKGANIIYFISMILLIAIGSIVQRWDFNYGILITEFILIALPALLYAIIKKTNIKNDFRFNKLSFSQITLIFTIFISGYFVAVFLNLVGNILLSLFGELVPPQIPAATNSIEYLVLLLIIAGSAGLCEEILFRGLLLRAYEDLGQWKSIMVTSILFGMLHLNMQNFIGPAFLGLLLGYVVYKTNSIFAGMLGHFINNAISVTLQYVIMRLPFYNGTNYEVAAGSMTQSLIAASVMFGILALIMGSLMILCMKALDEPLSESNVKVNDFIQTRTMGTILKNIKESWPIYITTLIFLIMSTMQIYSMMKG